MSNSVATLNQQMVSDIDSLADFWRSAAATAAETAAPSPGKRKRQRRRSKTPPPIANP